MNNKSRIIGLLLFSFIFLIHQAHASIIDNGLTTLDDATGLVWLDLSETLGTSATAALAAYPDYRMATGVEIREFWDHNGVRKDIVGDTGPLTTDETDFSSLMGGWSSDTIDSLVLSGWYDDQIGTPADVGLARIKNFHSNNAVSVTRQPFIATSTTIFSDVAVYLVKPAAAVPEPTSLIVCLGLTTAFGLVRRRRC